MAASRLPAVDVPADPAQNESYSLDGEGNRIVSHLSSIHISDAANRLIEDQFNTYLYRGDGTRTSKTPKAAGQPVINFDFDNMAKLRRVRDGAVDVEVYDYDQLHRRVLIASAQTNSSQFRPVLDGALLMVYDGEDRVLDLRIAQDAGTGAWSYGLESRYTHGASVDEPLLLERFDPATGTATTPGPLLESLSYHADHQGSVRWMTDPAGAVANEYDYDSYGRPNIISEAVPQPYLYTGREYDRATGLYYYRARYYDPETGTFTQDDPIHFAAGDFECFAPLFQYQFHRIEVTSGCSMDGLLEMDVSR